MRVLLSVLTMAIILAGSPASANQNEFCAGFQEGYRSIKGSMVMVPMCPMAPMTPMGSTPFREGIKAGIAAAQR